MHSSLALFYTVRYSRPKKCFRNHTNLVRRRRCHCYMPDQRSPCIIVSATKNLDEVQGSRTYRFRIQLFALQSDESRARRFRESNLYFYAMSSSISSAMDHRLMIFPSDAIDGTGCLSSSCRSTRPWNARLLEYWFSACLRLSCSTALAAPGSSTSAKIHIVSLSLRTRLALLMHSRA